MKRILIALAVLFSVQLADAQVTPDAARKALDKAIEATRNEKKAAKPDTWLKLAAAYMDAYNARLEVFAKNAGVDFIDVAPYMKDSTGGMATRYCSDEYVHVTDLGAAAWIRVLKAYDY